MGQRTEEAQQLTPADNHILPNRQMLVDLGRFEVRAKGGGS